MTDDLLCLLPKADPETRIQNEWVHWKAEGNTHRRMWMWNKEGKMPMRDYIIQPAIAVDNWSLILIMTFGRQCRTHNLRLNLSKEQGIIVYQFLSVTGWGLVPVPFITLHFQQAKQETMLCSCKRKLTAKQRCLTKWQGHGILVGH